MEWMSNELAGDVEALSVGWMSGWISGVLVDDRNEQLLLTTLSGSGAIE